MATLLCEDFKTQLKEANSTIIFILMQKLQQFPGGFSHLHKLFVQNQEFLHLIAAIWRPKSFIFSRGTAIGPELTCIVPDFPDVSVQIPQSCVPVDQDFCVTIKVRGTV